jgi:hypothetical protein
VYTLSQAKGRDEFQRTQLVNAEWTFNAHFVNTELIFAYSMLHRLDNLHKSIKDPRGTLESTLTDFQRTRSQRRLDFSANSANLAPTQFEY